MTRKRVLWIGLVVIVLMGLVPPWQVHPKPTLAQSAASLLRLKGASPPSEELRYRFILADHEWKQGRTQYRGRIHVGQLLAQLFVAGVIVGGLAYLTGDKAAPKEDEDQIAR